MGSAISKCVGAWLGQYEIEAEPRVDNTDMKWSATVEFEHTVETLPRAGLAIESNRMRPRSYWLRYGVEAETGTVAKLETKVPAIGNLETWMRIAQGQSVHVETPEGWTLTATEMLVEISPGNGAWTLRMPRGGFQPAAETIRAAYLEAIS